MTAFAMIVVESSFGILKVPNAALRFTPESGAADISEQDGAEDKSSDGVAAVVWTLKDGVRLIPIRIRVGNSDATSTEVTAGALVAEQSVIVDTVTPPERSSLIGLRIGF
jgi:HlyD family secretion protein